MGKVIVFGVVKRNGQVKAMPNAAHSRAEVMRQIQADTREGSRYYTNQCQAHATLKARGEHVMIRKETGRPLGGDHINGIEGLWSHAMNRLYPYRGLPTNFFRIYLARVYWLFYPRGEDLNPCLNGSLRPRASRKSSRF